MFLQGFLVALLIISRGALCSTKYIENLSKFLFSLGDKGCNKNKRIRIANP